MKNISRLAIYICLFFYCVGINAQNDKEISLIPWPNEIEIKKGMVHMQLDKIFFEYNAAFMTNLSQEEQNVVGFHFNNLSELWFRDTITASRSFFFLEYDTTYKNEAYGVEIETFGVHLKASTVQGFRYAIETLRQLGDFHSGGGVKVIFPKCIIKDNPRFSYRGMHLDVSRHFFTPTEVKQFILTMSQYKLNTLHWHLTDDQGWRIEIKKYPKLQEIAAFREKTMIGGYTTADIEFDTSRYGGFYTQGEIRDIIAFAELHQVTIIPEIELPGHARAALAAYPEFSCSGEQLPVAGKWGVFEHVYCSKDETLTFLKDVLSEVMELFPSDYIHIGGDEVPTEAWSACSQCAETMKKQQFNKVEDIQTYIVNEMIDYIHSKGKKAIGWDEILTDKLIDDAIIMSWRGEKGGIAAARKGHPVIMTPNNICYFDYYQSQSQDEPLAIGGLNTIHDIYMYNPVPEVLTDAESEFIIGVQGNHWTEYITEMEHLMYMAYPRGFALSEIAWTNTENKNYADFIRRAMNESIFLKRQELNIADRFVDLSHRFERNNKGHFLVLEKNDSCCGTIQFSLNNGRFEIYIDSIAISDGDEIKARVVENERVISGLYSWSIILRPHIFEGAKVSSEVSPDWKYSYVDKLCDGIVGNRDFNHNKQWTGWYQGEFTVRLSKEKAAHIHTIEIPTYVDTSLHIYIPQKIHVKGLLNGKTIFEKNMEFLRTSDSKVNKGLVLKQLNETVDALEISVSQGGKDVIKTDKEIKIWTFLSEIIVN